MSWIEDVRNWDKGLDLPFQMQLFEEVLKEFPDGVKSYIAQNSDEFKASIDLAAYEKDEQRRASHMHWLTIKIVSHVFKPLTAMAHEIRMEQAITPRVS